MTDPAFQLRDSLAGQIIEATPSPTILVDAHGTILHENGEFRRFIGQSTGVARTSFLNLIDHRVRESVATHLAAKDATAHHRTLNFRMTTDHGRSTPVEAAIRTITVESDTCFLITLRDVREKQEYEEQLQTSELLLAEAQRIAQIGSWRWDVASDQIEWSAELYRIFGITPSENPLDFESYLSLIHPADQDRVRSIIEQGMRNHTSFDMEHRILRPDGTVRLMFGRGSVRLNDAGEMTSMVGTAQDITERKANEAQAFQLALEQAARQEAERTKERFQYLAEISEVLAASLDYETTLNELMRQLIPELADWCVVNTLEQGGRINRLAVGHRDPAKQEILEAIRPRGFLPHGNSSHPLSRALWEATPELHAQVTDDLLQRIARNDSQLELARRLNPTSVMLIPLLARGRTFGILTFGISDHRRQYTEADLQLAVEIGHRAAVSIDNAQLYREAQDAARAREEFVSLVSHELKTPLTVIKGYMQVMQRYLKKPTWEPERIVTTMERLATQVIRLELLIADILDVSRMQRGRLDLDTSNQINLADLARHVVERFDDAIERKPTHSFNVTADAPVYGYWDPLRIDQVFSNLVSNALKYSPDGGRIDVEIRNDEENAIIRVSDQGVGIPAEELKTLFQPFQRGAVSARGISGTGLGLYISRQIIEQHSGTITPHSEPGIGSTFTITLPKQPVEHSDIEHHTNSFPLSE